MSNRSRQPGSYTRYTRRRRRPALIGGAAFASVIMLALGGLLLVGLDTVGSGGERLARVTQPEVAQAPEVTKKAQDEKQSDNQDEKQNENNGSGEQASRASGNSEDSGSSGGSKDPDGNSGSGEEGDEKPEDRQQASASEAEKESSRASENPEKSDKSDNKSGKKDKKDKEERASKQEEKQKQEDQGPQKPPPPANKTMGMTIPRLAMQGDTVYNSGQPSTMDVGAIKLPPTAFPWQGGANTYISAHRIGYPGTQSRYQFYNLPAMQQGDAVYLTDANGTTYEYRVTKKFAVKPWENWVTEPKAGKDMVTLQTCVDSLDPSTWWDISPKLLRSGPDSARLIVRAEKVETYYPQGY